jgi:hypothetical protein
MTYSTHGPANSGWHVELTADGGRGVGYLLGRPDPTFSGRVMITSLVPVTLNPPAGPPRSEGIHVSRVIKGIAVEAKILRPEWVDPEDLSLVETDGAGDIWWQQLDPASKIRMSIGLAWEAWYVPQMGNVVLHPGEMRVEGIYMTHDGESLDAIYRGGQTDTGGAGWELCLHEIKATYKSTKTVGDLETQWMWLAQTKAYCKGLGTRIAFVHVLFLCGDYKYPITPQLKCWRVEYTQEEIDDNWELLTDYVRHRQLMEREDAGLEGGI